MSLSLNSISKTYIDHHILDNVSFSLTKRQIVGLIGINGSGKSTLLKIIAGLESPDSGSVSLVPSTLSLGYVPQVSDFDPHLSVTEAIAQSLSLPESDYYQIYIALNKLKLHDLAFQPISTLSSGQKTKIFLARLLVQTPDILLLDEPTNHLDLDSLVWLEDYLKSFPGSVLLVSHDRRFLDNTVTQILEIDQCHLKTYGGNYSFYKIQKQQELASLARQYQAFTLKQKRLQDRITKVKNRGQQLEAKTNGSDYYLRKKAAAAASVAKSQEKILSKELIQSGINPPPPEQHLSVIFCPAQESSQTVVYLNNISHRYGQKQIISNLSLVIQKGDRLALTGPNGSGKSTFVKIILNQINPTEGHVQLGQNVKIGYLPQEHSDLNSSMSLIEYLKTQTHLDHTSAYRLAIHFLFTPDDMSTPVNNLSSGQKSKLSLAIILASGANFLILDEPTNYLDIPAREALESALASYTGTLLVISHDRYFLDSLKLTKTINL